MDENEHDDYLPDTQTPDVFLSFESKQCTPPWGRLFPCIEGLEPVDLIEETFIFGRSYDCNVVVHQSKLPEQLCWNISKVHFKIYKEFGEPIYIKDFSKNGTSINGNQIGKGNKNILQNDDLIGLNFSKQNLYIFKTMESDEDNYLPETLKKKYVISRLLGRGACGEVRLALHKITCKKYAIKKIIKAKYISANKDLINHPNKIKTEVQILTSLENPFIINVEEVIETENEVFIVLEYMSGGELTNRILSINSLTETNIKSIFYQIVLGVQYLHQKNITHRDLKPQNVLLATDDVSGIVKISDFGLSKIMDDNSMMETVCGTLYYAAPEVLDSRVNSYNKQIDVWSLGVILFYMFTKTLPFEANDRRILSTLIVTGAIKWNEENWKNVSKEAKDLVRKMLIVNPQKRITINGILKHPWIDKDFKLEFKFQKILSNDDSSQSQEDNDWNCPPKRPRLDNKYSNFHHHHQEERSPIRNSKLQAVFSKLSGVLPRAQDLGNNHKAMSSDVIESVLTDSPIPVPTSCNYEQSNNISDEQRGLLCLTQSSISHRLELELRQAKRTLLACGEVLLPCGLLYRISRDILSMAESEPCGIRGCLLHLNFEGTNECRKLSTVKCDPSTATTFELNLILTQNSTGWNFIPQFIKNLARGGTIVVSPAYTLSKKKLYRSILE